MRPVFQCLLDGEKVIPLRLLPSKATPTVFQLQLEHDLRRYTSGAALWLIDRTRPKGLQHFNWTKSEHLDNFTIIKCSAGISSSLSHLWNVSPASFWWHFGSLKTQIKEITTRVVKIQTSFGITAFSNPRKKERKTERMKAYFNVLWLL